jgi:hypothetical protein
LDINVKDIIIKPINSTIANAFVKKHHYSGKVTNNSQLHFGAFYNDVLHGVMSFGPSLDKSNIIGLVKNTKWNDFLELNRMAFDDFLPKNSESRSISIALKLIKKHYPNIKWIISFADGTQCGDGTIYRASGFTLTAIRESTDLARLPDGEVIHSMTIKSNPTQKRKELGGKTAAEVLNGSMSFNRYCKAAGAEVLSGFQLRYIYFIDKTAKERLTVPILPYSAIDKMGAGMYLGKKKTSGGSVTVAQPAIQQERGGSIPTSSQTPSQGETNE